MKPWLANIGEANKRHLWFNDSVGEIKKQITKKTSIVDICWADINLLN